MKRLVLALSLLSAAPAFAQTSDGSCPAAADGGGGGAWGGFLGALRGIFDWARGGSGGAGEVNTTTPGPGGRTVVTKTRVETVQPAGCDMTTVTFWSDVAVSTEIEGENEERHVGGGVDARAGKGTILEMTLPDDRWAQVKDGNLPNPFDPTTLPPGSTVILKQEAFVSLGLEGTWRELVVKSEVRDAAGAVVAVTRTEDGKIRLSVGPYDAVQNEAFVGAGPKGARIGLNNWKRLEDQSLTTWEFDPSNPDDMRQYRLAMTTGAFTSVGMGVDNRPKDKVEYLDYKDLTSVRVELGPLALEKNLLGSSLKYKVTTHPDGTKDVDAVGQYGDQYLILHQHVDANGQPVGEPHYEVKLASLSDWNAQMLSQAMGQANPGSTAQVSLEGDDWKVWRDRAKAAIAQNPGAGMSTVLNDIANAQSSFDVERVIYTGARQNTMTFQDIEFLTHDPKDPRKSIGPLPGTLSPTTTCE